MRPFTRPPSTARAAWVVGMAAALAGCAAPGSPTPTADTMVSFHDPVYGVSLKRPTHWRRLNRFTTAIGAHDGFFGIGPAAGADLTPVSPLDMGMLTTHRETFWADGHEATLVVPRFGSEMPGRVTVRLPEPLRGPSWPEPLMAITLSVDAAHLHAIGKSLRFERSGTAYALGVLDVLEQHYYRQSAIDWPTLRRTIAESARDARTPAEAEPAVRAAITALGDRHTAYWPPADFETASAPSADGFGFETVSRGDRTIVARVLPGGAAAAAGLLTGDMILAFEPASSDGRAMRVRYERPGTAGPTEAHLVATPFTQTASPVFSMRGAIAYLEIPGFFQLEGHDAFENTLVRAIAEGRAAGARAWVLDVRRNTGGMITPMLRPLDALTGELAPSDGSVAGPPPVAVLTSPMTASAGEYIVMGFSGRPRARTFGEPTYGVPTSMTPFFLWDGGFLNVSVAAGIDAAGRTHDGPITPDELIETPFERFGAADDPVVSRALAWLQTQVSTP
jgi:C-terminal processing protease CtpA/Prc